MAKAKHKQKKSRRPSAPKPSPPAVPPMVPVSLSPSPTTWRIVSRQQLAELMGQHPDTITDFAREGMPVTTRGGHGKLGEYDAVECLDWWRARIGKNAKEIAQTRALNASAEINEIKRAQLEGTLVNREDVLRSGQMYVAAWKAMVIGLARRLSQDGVIDLETEPAVEARCRAMMREIASWQVVKDLEAVPGYQDELEEVAV